MVAHPVPPATAAASFRETLRGPCGGSPRRCSHTPRNPLPQSSVFSFSAGRPTVRATGRSAARRTSSTSAVGCVASGPGSCIPGARGERGAECGSTCAPRGPCTPRTRPFPASRGGTSPRSGNAARAPPPRPAGGGCPRGRSRPPPSRPREGTAAGPWTRPGNAHPSKDSPSPRNGLVSRPNAAGQGRIGRSGPARGRFEESASGSFVQMNGVAISPSRVMASVSLPVDNPRPASERSRTLDPELP